MEYVIFFLLVWMGVYIYSVNRQSRAAFLLMLFVICLAFFYVGDFTTRKTVDHVQADIIWRIITGAYIIPIAILFHLSLVVTDNKSRVNRHLLYTVYGLAFFLYLAALTTDHYIGYDVPLEETGDHNMIHPRGPLFSLLGVLILLSVGGGLLNILNAKNLQIIPKRLFTSAYFLYLVIGLSLFGLYYFPPQQEFFLIAITPFLFVIPLIPILISVFFYNYPRDIGNLINLKEAAFSLLLLGAIFGIYFAIVYNFFSPTEPALVLIYFVLIALIILTHTFYDWFTTFIRDIVYNLEKGFSIISDSDTQHIINNFHRPERLKDSPLIKFSIVRESPKKPIDAARELVREAIEYFKQPDHPRRTKQNLKYHILKMMTFDEANEGQILWELGFEDYPAKILTREDTARKPLFKVEAMSDYTATSRNAFVILKKEAIHDLTWRLSYLEKHSR